MENYEEEKLKLTHKMKHYENRLTLLMTKIEEQSGCPGQETEIPVPILDGVWYVTYLGLVYVAV